MQVKTSPLAKDSSQLRELAKPCQSKTQMRKKIDRILGWALALVTSGAGLTLGAVNITAQLTPDLKPIDFSAFKVTQMESGARKITYAALGGASFKRTLIAKNNIDSRSDIDVDDTTIYTFSVSPEKSISFIPNIENLPPQAPNNLTRKSLGLTNIDLSDYSFLAEVPNFNTCDHGTSTTTAEAQDIIFSALSDLRLNPDIFQEVNIVTTGGNNANEIIVLASNMFGFNSRTLNQAAGVTTLTNPNLNNIEIRVLNEPGVAPFLELDKTTIARIAEDTLVYQSQSKMGLVDNAARIMRGDTQCD